MRTGLDALIEDKDHIAGFDAAVPQSSNGFILIVKDLGGAPELVELGRNCGLLDKCALGYQITLAQNEAAVAVQGLGQRVNDVGIAVDAALNVFTQSFTSDGHTCQVQLAGQLVEKGPQAAGSLKVRHTAFAVGPDADQKRHLAAGFGVDAAAVHVQASFCGHSRNVDDGVGGAADSHTDPDGVSNGGFRDDIPGTDVLLPQLHHLPASFPTEVDELAGHGGHGGVAGQGHADGLRQQAHGVGSTHHAAGATAWRAGVNQLLEFFRRHFAFLHLRDAGTNVDEVHIISVHDGGFHVAAGDDDGGNIHPTCGHQHGGNHLVAGADENHGVQVMCLDIEFDLIDQ